MASMVCRPQPSIRSHLTIGLVVVALNVAFAPWAISAHLSPLYYASSCPNLESTVSSAFQNALSSDGRIAGSLLRMHFHDCFVQGCDASILLRDTDTFIGEQTAFPNNNSLRGFNVIDDIKSSVESICPATVFCADILALLARDAVVAAGGPYWIVELGRRDSTTASFSEANSTLPLSSDPLDTLLSKFSGVGFDQTDMVSLSGAHTIGKAQCKTFSARLYDFNETTKSDPTIDSGYLAILQSMCPQGGSTTTLEDLDQGTPTTFDNSYYANLIANKGLLGSDQKMETEGGGTADLVRSYSSSETQFFFQFVYSIIKMGRIHPLTGSLGEVRTTCGCVN